VDARTTAGLETGATLRSLPNHAATVLAGSLIDLEFTERIAGAVYSGLQESRA
jgi:hypothetical protein